MNRIALPSRIPLTFVAAFALLLVIYLSTAGWASGDNVNDTNGAALAGWNLVETGSLAISEETRLAVQNAIRHGAWLVETPNGYYTNRSPGIIGVAALGYLLAAPFVSEFVHWPATLMAVVTSAAAAFAAARLTERLMPGSSTVTLITVGLATGMWGVASVILWPHGPTSLVLVLALTAIAVDRLRWAGVAFAVSILLRPISAIIAAVVGIGLAVSRRSWKPLLEIGLPASVGAVLYLLYGKVVFGSWGIFTLYGGEPLGTVDSFGHWGQRFFELLLAPERGLLVWSPWILLAAVSLPRIWPLAADWARVALVAALAFLAAHIALNRVSGGPPFNNRYAIEALVISSPMLIPALLSRNSPLFRWLIVATITVGIGLQAIYAFLAECQLIEPGLAGCRLFGF